MVRVRGLEPLSLTAQPPQDCVSTSFTTPASKPNNDSLFDRIFKYFSKSLASALSVHS